MYGSRILRFYFLGKPMTIRGIKKHLGLTASEDTIRRWLHNRRHPFYIQNPNFFDGIDDKARPEIEVIGVGIFKSYAAIARHFGIRRILVQSRIKAFGEGPYPEALFTCTSPNQQTGKLGGDLTAKRKTEKTSEWDSFKDKPRKKLKDITNLSGGLV